MKCKKVYAWLLAVSMIFACFTTPILAEGEGTASDIYKASDAWYAPADGTAENTYRGHTEWKWERKDSGQDWFDFAKFHTNKRAFGMTPGNVIGDETVRIAGSAWTTEKADWNHPAVGEGWMLPYMKTGNPDYAVSKTFTAPKTGKVRLSTEDGSIYGGSGNPGNASNRTAFIRITVNDRQIWPAEGRSLRIPETTTQEYKFEPVEILLRKNDKLRFEVYNGDSTEQYGKYVYWKPVVEYLPDSPINNSYDALDADITAGTFAGNSGWTWQNIRGDITNGWQGFTTLTNGNKTSGNVMNTFVEPDKNADGTYNYASFKGQGEADTQALSPVSNPSNAPKYNAMSRWWMRTTNIKGKNTNHENTIAKVFTAPRAGTLQISAVDLDGNNKIWGKKVKQPEKTLGAKIFIQKTAANVKADETKTTVGSDGVYFYHQFMYDAAKDVNDGCNAVSTDFEPITIDVTEDERIWFIIKDGADKTDASYDPTNLNFVHWNPVVTYLSSDDFNMEVDKSSVAFTGADSTALTSFAAIAAADSFSVSANVKLQNALALGSETRSAVMMAIVYDGDGNIVGKGFNEQTINKDSGDSVTFNIENITTTSTPAEGSVKVFLFDSLQTLNPLSDIGNSPIYASDNGTAPAAQMGFRGMVTGGYTGESVSAAIYDGDNITADNLLYIDQNASDDGGKIDIPLPVAYNANNKFASNIAGALYSKDIPIYCSAAGTADGLGTETSTVTFQRALELAEDGGTVMVDGTVTLPEGFAWPVSNKTITVEGKNNAAIDIKTIKDLNINTNTTFRTLTIDCSQTTTDGKVTGENTISANGKHVIIEDSVKTSNVIRTLRGGSSKKSVASTNLEVYGGNYNTIIGGCSSDGGAAVSVNGDCNLTVGGNVNSDLDENNWDNLTRTASIHGGGNGGSVGGDCTLTLKGDAKAKYVYGGQNGLNAATTTGKIAVNVEGGSFMNVFAVLKNTKNENNTAVKVNTTAELTMIGGKVEALMGAQEAIEGNITIKALGGTITRRVFGGCYNDSDDGVSFKTTNSVKGSVTVVIGPELTIDIVTKLDSGIFGGSRIGSNPAEEISKLIFVNGAYEKHGEYVGGKSGTTTACDSHHDYLVKASAGGTVTSSGASQITITPETGKVAWVNNKKYSSETLDLTEKTTAVDFHEEGYEPKYTVSGTIGSNITSLTLTGSKEENTHVINAAELINGEFSVELIADTYTISVQPVDDEYEAVVKNKSGAPINQITVTDAAITGISATATQKTYAVTVNTDAGISSVTIKANAADDGTTKTIQNNTAAFELPKASGYIIELTTVDAETIVSAIKVGETDITEAGTFDVTAATTITVTTGTKMYTIGGTVDANVKGVTLVDKNDESKKYTGTIKDNNTSVEVKVPKGSYRVDVVCNSGYRKTNDSTTEIDNVAADNATAITVSTEVITTPVYTVSGTAGEGIASVKLVSGDDEYTGVIGDDGTVEIVNVPDGTYEVIAAPAQGYDNATVTYTNGSNVVVNGDDVSAAFTVEAQLKQYKVTVNADAGVSTVKITRGDFVKEMTLSENTAETELPKANEYTLEITTADNKVIKSITANGNDIKDTKKFDVTGETTIVIVTETSTEPPEPTEGILSASYSDGTATVSYNVNTEEDGVLIVAIYNPDKTLKTVVSKEIEIGSESADLPIQAALEQGTTYTLKAMIWNSLESMIPKYVPYPTEFTR